MCLEVSKYLVVLAVLAVLVVLVVPVVLVVHQVTTASDPVVSHSAANFPTTARTANGSIINRTVSTFST